MYLFQRPPHMLDEFPLHKCAADGDADGIRNLLRENHKVTQPDKESMMPIHHAAW